MGSKNRLWLVVIRHILLITFVSACATAQKSELEKDMELVAGFTGENEQIDANAQVNTNSDVDTDVAEEDAQQFEDEQNFQQDQQFDGEQNFQQDQQFDGEQNFQQDQQLDEQQNLQQDQQFDGEQNFQQDQQLDEQQNLQQGQQFDQLQELNDQFGQVMDNQANAFGEPPLQQGQSVQQQQSLDFGNSFNDQLSDNAPISLPNSNNNLATQSLPDSATVQEEKPDPIETILEEFKGIPEPNEFSGAELPGTMKKLAPGEAPETYIIRPGDTLYDICDQLLDEATYWPKLWAMNSDIKNPHFIYPKFELQFYPGDLDTPPVIKVVNIEEFEPEGDIKPNAAVETEKLFKEKENNFELLDPEDVVIPEKIDELFAEDVGRYVEKEFMTVELPALVLPSRLDSLGKVLRGDSSMLEGETVLLKGGGLSVGTLYTVMRHRGLLWGVGYRYDFIANVRILSNDDGSYASATLVNLNSAPRKGDIVVDYRSRQRRVESNPSGSVELAAKIAALTLQGQSLGMAGDFAFMKIPDEGISSQQLLNIYRSTSRSYRKKSKVLDSHPIGTMQVIDVQDDIAIAYITNSDQEIMVGDKTSP